MSKVITVFGATGNQGGSVIKAIQADSKLSNEFKIRGVTRDTSKPAAQALASKGVDVVSADMNSKESVSKAIAGSHSVFLVTNFWESADPKVEVSQGKIVTDAAKEQGVSQLIFSSLVNTKEATGGKLHVVHFDSKADVEKYIRDSGITSTFVQAGYFMSNFPMQLRPGDDGNYQLFYPIPESSKFPLIDIPEDYGKFVVPALRDPAKFNGKQIRAAQGMYTVKDITSQFTEVTGKKVNFIQVSAEQYKNSMPPRMGQEMLDNHLLIGEPGYYGGHGLDESLGYVEGVKLTSWKDYVAKTFKQ